MFEPQGFTVMVFVNRWHH